MPDVPVPAPPLCLYEHVGSLLADISTARFHDRTSPSAFVAAAYLPGLKREFHV